MSKSSAKQFSQSADRAAAKAGGGHLTREARDRTLDRLQDRLDEAGYGNLVSVDQLALRHIEAYVESRIQDGVSPRTLQNELSHIRAVMLPDRAQAPQMTNQALGSNYRWDQGKEKWVPLTQEDRDRGITGGVTGGSRIGSKTAVTSDELRGWTDHAQGLGREGIAAALEVSRELGLRSQEIIRADAEQLRTWSREAAEKGRVTVVHGTKGGRVRDTTVVDPARTVPVLERAAAVAEAQGGYLITKADGSPAKSLKSATTIYRSYNDRHDVDAHRCRYAYAREVYQHYRDQGYSHREACSRTSVDLGHGDGRGRYINSVYLR